MAYIFTAIDGHQIRSDPENIVNDRIEELVNTLDDFHYRLEIYKTNNLLSYMIIGRDGTQLFKCPTVIEANDNTFNLEYMFKVLCSTGSNYKLTLDDLEKTIQQEAIHISKDLKRHNISTEELLYFLLKLGGESKSHIDIPSCIYGCIYDRINERKKEKDLLR